MVNVKTLLLEQDLNINNIPQSILDIEIETPYFNKGVIDNRVYILTGEHTHILGEYNDEIMKSDMTYELILNLNKIKTTTVNDLLTYLDNENAFDKKYSKELLKEYNNIMNTIVLTYTIREDNFTHRIEYNALGGVISHS